MTDQSDDWKSDPHSVMRVEFVDNVFDQMDCKTAADFIAYLHKLSEESGVPLAHLAFSVDADPGEKVKISVSRPCTLEDHVQSEVGMEIQRDEFHAKRFVNHPRSEWGWPILTQEERTALEAEVRATLIAEGLWK